MLLIDAHVHVYDVFHAGALFAAAAANFQRAMAAHGIEGAGVLMLTETSRDRWFEAARKQPDILGPGWRLQPVAGEPRALRAISETAAPALLVVAGQQIATAERMEVMALGTTERLRDGSPLAETLSEVAAQGALPLVPWGAGKGLGRRGRLLTEVMKSDESMDFLLGDNGGRTALWPTPAHLRLAHRTGRRVLSGTDPLPLRGEERRVGSFGAILHAQLPENEPVGPLLRPLADPGTKLQAYGRLTSPLSFLSSQARLRLSHRGRRSAALSSK